VSVAALEIDRIQVAVADRVAAAQAWVRLLDAVPLREDRVRALGCRRSVLGVGRSELELLEAEGAGPVAEAGVGLFAAGLGADDPGALRAALEAQGVACVEEAGQLHLSPAALGVPGLRLVVSPLAPRERHGLLERLYEVTHLSEDAPRDTARLAECLGLDAAAFVPIRSELYGYDGTLTLFRAGRLDRIEVIHPFDRSKTMGRFFARRGPSLYMAYAETDRAGEVRDRARELASRDWTGPRDGAPDNLFLHPKALGGVMLGVSRTSYAWTWSGAPERVAP